MRLMFGVFLRGVFASLTAKNVNKILAATIGQFCGMRKFTCPVCLFLFTLQKEEAFFSWLAEPVIASGAPKLLHHEKATCVLLSDDLLNQHIELIVSWYDAVETVLIA